MRYVKKPAAGFMLTALHKLWQSLHLYP